jgi:hypothetical protein
MRARDQSVSRDRTNELPCDDWAQDESVEIIPTSYLGIVEYDIRIFLFVLM